MSSPTRKTRTIVLLSILCLHQVAALLDISKDALGLTESLRGLVGDDKSAYASRADVEKKLNAASKLALSYIATVEEFRNQTNVDRSIFAGISAACTVRLVDAYFAEYSQDARDKLAYLRLVASDDRPFYDYFRGKSFERAGDERPQTELDKERSLLLRMNGTHEGVFDEACGRSVFDDLSRSAQTCGHHQSRQQIIFSVLKNIALTDVEYYIGLQHAYAGFKVLFDARNLLTDSEKERLKSQTETWQEEDMIKKMTKAERYFVDRNAKTLSLFRAAMAKASRVAWVCDGEREEEEQTYTKLNKLFQKYILNEADLDESASCMYDCSVYQRSKVYGCYDQQICEHQVSCTGNIWECGEDITSDIEICGRRRRRHGDSYGYDYMKVGNQQYGKKPNTCDNPLDIGGWLRWPYRCNYCLCTCEHSTANSDMYFNLRPVMADIQKNKIVTGVTFQKVNHVVHVQIQEGELLKNGIVHYSEWKPIENYTISDTNVTAKIDYHAITWESGRAVYLDTLTAPESYAITGIRFNSVDDNIRLEIHATELDFKTGELSKSNSRWIFRHDSLQDRDEVHVGNLKQNQTTVFDETNQFFKFTTSSIELDAGQSTIPFLDIQPVETKPPIPLSGAGLFLKHNQNVGPTMALKVVSFDFSSNIDA